MPRFGCSQDYLFYLLSTVCFIYFFWQCLAKWRWIFGVWTGHGWGEWNAEAEDPGPLSHDPRSEVFDWCPEPEGVVVSFCREQCVQVSVSESPVWCMTGMRILWIIGWQRKCVVADDVPGDSWVLDISRKSQWCCHKWIIYRFVISVVGILRVVVVKGFD